MTAGDERVGRARCRRGRPRSSGALLRAGAAADFAADYQGPQASLMPGAATKTKSSLMCLSIRRHRLPLPGPGRRDGTPAVSAPIAAGPAAVAVLGDGQSSWPPRPPGQLPVFGVQRLQVVDVPQQVHPAPLLQSRVVMIGSIEVADQHPTEGLIQHLVHHLLVAASPQEIALGGCFQQGVSHSRIRSTAGWACRATW